MLTFVGSIAAVIGLCLVSGFEVVSEMRCIDDLWCTRCLDCMEEGVKMSTSPIS